MQRPTVNHITSASVAESAYRRVKQRGQLHHFILPRRIRLVVMRTNLFFVVAVVHAQLAIVASSPYLVLDGGGNETGILSITPAPPTCQPFAVPYCNSLGEGYNMTIFPNERGFGFNESRKEFNDFMSLMESGCSAKVRMLFCFFYFPFCAMVPYRGQTKPKPFLPCRETCQEVRSNCQMLLGNYSWPDWLDCSKDYFLPANSSDGPCVDGALSTKGPKEQPTGEPVQTTPTQSLVTTESTKESTTKSTTKSATESTTESTTETTTPTSAPCSCKRCNPRNRVTGGTFKNNAYTFAAKVTVVSVGHHNNMRIVTAHVNKAYPLKSLHQGRITEAPTMAEIIVININPMCCTPCTPLQLDTNATYIVAGYYEDHPSLQWNMPTDDSLASPWSPNASKYTKKMNKWIADANAYRKRQNKA